MQRAADRENSRPTENLLTKIESPAHGSLLAAQLSEAAASARTGAVCDENKIFVTRAWRRFCRTISDRMAKKAILLTKIAPVFATAARGAVVRLCLVGVALSSHRL